MTAQEWGIAVGVITSGLLAVAPWMFMVHAKLAVIAEQLTELNQKVGRQQEATEQLWELTAEHESRLDGHDIEIRTIRERCQERYGGR